MIQLYRWMDYWGHETVSAFYPSPPLGIDLDGGRWPWGCLGPLDSVDNHEVLCAIARKLDELTAEDVIQ